MSFCFFGGALNRRAFHESKGYFTVRELCRALADSEGLRYEGDHCYLEGLRYARSEGADGSVRILQAEWGLCLVHGRQRAASRTALLRARELRGAIGRDCATERMHLRSSTHRDDPSDCESGLRTGWYQRRYNMYISA